MEQKRFSLFVLLASLVVGIVGNVLFFGQAFGLSFPLFTAIVVGLILLSTRITPYHPNWRNLWPLIPLLFFATMIAIRADENITAINFVAVLALGGLTLHYLPLRTPIDTETIITLVTNTVIMAVHVLPAPPAILSNVMEWIRERNFREHRTLFAIGRGLLFALPIIAVFAVLLSSADLIFADYVRQILNIFTIQNLPELITRLVLVLCLAWLMMGTMVYTLARPIVTSIPEPEEGEVVEDASNPSPPKRGKKGILNLGMIEATIILGAVDLLFAVFVLIQLAYFFGGQLNIESGLTYSNYARRGFFELVAVSVLTLGLVLVLDKNTVRYGKRESGLFQLLSVVIIALTSVMLISATQRMFLYEEAYGFTHLRVYTHIFILWLTVLFGFFLLALFRIRERTFSLGILIFLIGYVATLNILNVDYYIAERNIARYHNGEELDLAFFYALSADAVPVVFELYQTTADSNPEIHENLGAWLGSQYLYLIRMRSDSPSIFAAHWGRDSYWALLNPIQDELSDYYAPLDRYRTYQR